MVQILSITLVVCLVALPSLARAEQNMESAIQEQAVSSSIYHRPYSLWESQTDKMSLARNSALLFGVGLGGLGILGLMPSKINNWESKSENPAKKWWRNVSRPPVWDKDDFWLNYIAHPYCGAVYYMGARSAGAGAGYAFAYSFALSTFFWEYGIEAFAERPSIQDLIITPVTGSILGELFYLLKRRIVENDYCLANSSFLGHTAAWLIDPISELTNLFWDDSAKSNIHIQSSPRISSHGKLGGYVVLTITF